ncbi:hypothetical protein ASPVEDRAFT_47063 [Aspergillus versicolor CBS 583.65]|uniref:Uncharacterized protein n=1 Tax=Aspergillus versicolor CBS 583.65 TaxID=1036611 RepID=A0A1L9Q279_ASPVE|nr:uncharacterized protein ASPVEDRAFT_47063 [Aspergillus versicolor CBS 583.65]OJJ07870.1 hypothetical protein ASPVEDRAFT_47063 [Aspergillus versicolor CBS 583.65]
MASDSAPSQKGPWQRELEAYCRRQGLGEPIYQPVTQEARQTEHGCRVRVGDDVFSSRRWHSALNKENARANAREDTAEEAVLYYKRTIEQKYTNLLCERLEAGDHRGLEQCIHSGANVNGPRYPAEGYSPLLIAIRRRDTTAIRILLAAGADINYGGALRAAIRSGDANIVFTLLINGADVRGDGVLAAAAEWGDPEVLRMLVVLVAGADFANVPAGATITCQWELPQIFADEGSKLDIYRVPTMTKKTKSVVFSTCAKYLETTYGKQSIRLLDGIVCALKDQDGVYVKYGIIVRATSRNVSVIVNPSMRELLDAVVWLCLTFREPPPHGPQISTGELNHGKLSFKPWQPLAEFTMRDTCWAALFDSAVIVLEPSTTPNWGWILDITFENMVQLAAVEYPVWVDNGIVLMGYSTALIPAGNCSEKTMLWHLQVAGHDSQLNISELSVTKGLWWKTREIKDLRSERNLLGWCGNASVSLGTMNATADIKRSDAGKKHTSWQWTGANLQLVAQSGGPAQVGGQLGFAFCRKMMAVHFSASDNYLKCLRNSVSEQIIVYDAAQQRAWLVSLICVLHQMLLSYAKHHGLASGVPQTTSGSNNGGLASLEALKNTATSVIDRASSLELTVRDLIMGFSVNLSKTAVQKPSGRKVYGYEFWDIIEDSTHCELKQQQLERQGLAWAPLLGEIKCLFCSEFGDAIIGNRAASVQSPCNRVPARKDLMAASTCSLNALLERHGASLRVPNPSGILAGTPFQQCSHQGQKDTCWESPNFLQDVRGSNPDSQKTVIRADTYPNGAVVFGRSGNRYADMVQWVNLVIRK